MKSLGEIRKAVYKKNREQSPYIFEEWKWYHYRRLKAHFYMEGASIFTYLFLRLSVPPNVVTLIYALMGVFGGILLAVPSKSCIVIALVFFFSRGIFDWADGSVARATNRTSINGEVFDSYGALAGWAFLWPGLGFYLARYTSPVFYYTVPIIPALFAADLYQNARDTLIYHRLLGKITGKGGETKADREAEKRKVEPHGLESGAPSIEIHAGGVRRIKDFIDRIFEHNARTVDFILLLVLIELLYPVRLVWIFYLSFLMWQAVIFIMRLCMITRGGWAEKEAEKLKSFLKGQDK